MLPGRPGGGRLSALLDLMDQRSELSPFLRTRRDRMSPEEYGLPVGRRRSPGLRRAEIAQLAGTSVDYCIRLEQGQAGRPSAAVLDAVARVLRLTPDEREHLYVLARAETTPRRSAPTGKVRQSMRRLLELRYLTTPALVIGRRMDVLAWNSMAAALMAEDCAALPRSRRNLLWHAFCSPAARSLYVGWETAARQGIAFLRLSAGRCPDDPAIAALVGELSVRSEELRTWWAQHDVQDRGSGRKGFNRPLVGRLDLDYEALAVRRP